MESKIGSLLTFIAAVINFIAAGVIFIVGIIVAIALQLSYQINNELIIKYPWLITILIFLLSLVVLCIGLLYLMASRKMKNKKTVKNGAIWAIVLGALTLGQISGILSLIGGIIGIIDSDK